MNETPPNKSLILVADPMCSWCWGFAPAMAALRRDYRDSLAFRVVAGGLRPGTDAVMDGAAKAAIRHHWEDVATASGQPFDFAFFERDDFIYDTEPACRAVVAARAFGEDAALDLLDALHRAFYAENRDITDPGEIVRLAAAEGLDANLFAERLASNAAKAATAADFQAARALGVTGFPTLIAQDTSAGEAQYAYLSVGYRPYEALRPLLQEWLSA